MTRERKIKLIESRALQPGTRVRDSSPGGHPPMTKDAKRA